ncbi:MAG TPA: transporter substrate-binding domain-containing protein [Firmicutes bacterium]|nr:transporter substrate-binding domain-containing protein [Bacillota bacterium]
MKKLLALALVAIIAIGCLAGCGSSAKVKVIEIDLTSEEYAFGVDKTQPELLTEVNDFIKKIKEDGTFDEILNKYFGDGTPTPVTSAALDESKDQLVVATNAAFEPFEYMDGENYLGIDMEIAALLAEELGLELVISNMDFDSVCLSVGQQKCDIAMAGLTVNEARKEYVTFSDSYYNAAQRLVVMADDTTFDACTDAASVEAILNTYTLEDETVTKIGVQNGTTGQFYVQGDADWGFAGFGVECVGYKNGSLAVQDMINGNIKYVIIDSAPAKCITDAFNELG